MTGSERHRRETPHGGPWLNPKLVIAPSTIAGDGLFAVAPIARGEVCARLGGLVLSNAAFAAYVAGRDHYSALAIDDDRNLVQADDDPTSKGNHSCDPNLWLADAVTVVARRAIEPGEEATIDYALLTVDARWNLECRCGAANCRSTVRGDDWRRPELQRAYRGHWSPFIERRIDAGT